MSDLLTFTGDVEIQARAAGKPKLSILGYNGGIMSPGGWGPLAVDLAGMSLPGQIPVLADHNGTVSGIIGQGTPSVQAGRLSVQGEIIAATEAAKTVLELAKGGFQFQASLGAKPGKTERIRAGQSVTVNGQNLTAGDRGLTIIRSSELREISILPIGADGQTAVDIAARGNEMSDSTTTTTEPTAEQIERDRVSAIIGLTATYPAGGEIAATAVKEGWDASKAELEMLRSSRPVGPSNYTPSNVSGNVDVLTCSLAINAGCTPDFLKQTGIEEQTIDAAVSAGFQNSGLHDAMRLVAAKAGKHLRAGRLGNEDIRTAFEASRSLQASGFTSYSLPGILSNSMGKLLLQSFSAINTVVPRLFSTRPVRDFKETTAYRLTGAGTFEQVGPGGELKHGGFSEAEYKNKADTFGKIYTITRQDLVNDDLSAFAQIPAILGRQASLAREEAGMTLLMGSQTAEFFHADNKNLKTGSGSVLSIDGLEDAEQLFLDQVDADGKPILVVPSILLVPSTLSVTARQTLNSVEVSRDSSGDNLPTGNPFARQYELLVSPYLSNENFSGNSALAWYLLANPAGGVAAFEIVYLDGRSAPTIEAGDVDFSTLGVSVRGIYDFGVARQDHRGAVKSVGA